MKNIMKNKALLLALSAMTLVACAAMSSGAPTATRNTSLGNILTDSAGMTLYIFTRDTVGVSNCSGGCAASWPPFMAADGAKASGKFSLVTRSEGGQQWAYDGMPLYYWVGDSKPGDVTGQGVNNVWFVIPASGAAASTSSSSSYGY